MGRFQLELIYLYFPPSSHLYHGTTVEIKGKLILTGRTNNNTILKNSPDLKALKIQTDDFEGRYESVGNCRKLNEISLNGPAILDN